MRRRDRLFVPTIEEKHRDQLRPDEPIARQPSSRRSFLRFGSPAPFDVIVLVCVSVALGAEDNWTGAAITGAAAILILVLHVVARIRREDDSRSLITM